MIKHFPGVALTARRSSRGGRGMRHLQRSLAVGILILSSLAVSSAAAVTLNPGDLIVAHQSLSEAGIVRIDPLTGAQTVITSGRLLQEPRGIAIDGAGQIIVADQAVGGNGAILRVDPMTGTQTVIAAGGTFIDPFGIAIDPAGQLIITDRSGGGGLFRVDPLSGAQSVITTGGFLRTPYGVAVDSLGRYVVADDPQGTVANPGPGRLVRVDPVTGAQTLISSGGHPFFVAIDGAGDFIVTDRGDTVHSVVRIDATTGLETLLSVVTGGEAYGVAIDSTGQIITADNWNARILGIDPLTGVQSVLSSDGFLTDPTGIAIVPNAVPEPGTLLLLGSGLAGLARVTWSRRWATRARRRRGK